MSDTYERWDEIVPEDWPTPFTQVPTWLLFATCTPQAYRMWAFLAQHVFNALQLDPDKRIACPKQTAIAKVLRLKNPGQVGPYGRELERLGALRIEEFRYAGGMRRGYRYYLRFNPPPGHHGPVSLGGFYRTYPDLDSEMFRERRDGAAAAAVGGTENRNTGGTENRMSGGTENRTSGGTEIRTPRGTTDGTSRGTTDGTAQGTTGGTSHPPTDRGVRASLNRSAKEEAPNKPKPPPPPYVPVAEDARAEREEQKGPASPDDLSPEAAGGAAGTWPPVAPAGVKSAATQARPVEPRFGAMARDIIRTLPHVLQPATDDEREVTTWLIADKLAQGYPVPVIRQVLTADPPEHVKVKTAFIGHRLDHMAPWVPPQRPEHESTALQDRLVDELHRLDNDSQADRAWAVREQMRRQRAEKTQQQGTEGTEAG